MKFKMDLSRVLSNDPRDFVKDIIEMTYNSLFPFLFGFSFAQTGNLVYMIAFLLVMWLRLEVDLKDVKK